MEIPLTDIPEHASLRLDLKATKEDIASIFGELEDFHVTTPDSFEAQIRLQRMDSAVRLAGQVWVEMAYDCSRCLTPRTVDAHGELEYMLVSRANYDATYNQNEEMDLHLSDLDVDYYEGEDIDLRPFLRETILLSLPTAPTCKLVKEEDACEVAYTALVATFDQNVEDEKEEENPIDPRWAPLMALKPKDDGQN